jgi:hypothetical protein
MDAVRGLSGLNLNFLGLVTTAVTAGATTTTVTAVATGGLLTTARRGVKAILASAGAKAYAQYTAAGVADSTVKTLVATSTTGQAAIVVHCLKNVGDGGIVGSAGTETLVQVIGTIVNLDVNGTITSNGGVLSWPNLDDSLVPVAYTVVVNPAASSTATFQFGSSNWNATSIVTSNAGDLASLPRRPLTSTVSLPRA